MCLRKYLISHSAAAQEDPPSLEVKPGKCPEVQNLGLIECPTADNLVTECLLDKDCNSTRKCCSDGCSMRCALAEQVPTPANIIGPKGARGDKGDPVSE